MRALIQRVNEASVLVDGEVVGAIGTGVCVFIGVSHDDDLQKAEKMASKIWNLRIFEDEDQRMNKSLGEAGGEVLVVSQFTLYGDTAKGRRPSFVQAALHQKWQNPLSLTYASRLKKWEHKLRRVVFARIWKCRSTTMVQLL